MRKTDCDICGQDIMLEGEMPQSERLSYVIMKVTDSLEWKIYGQKKVKCHRRCGENYFRHFVRP